MRGISLWQPWASLIFSGDKKHETRSYRCPAKLIGQEVLIHAAKVVQRDTCLGLHLLCEREFGSRGIHHLPRGAIIGSVRIVACLPAEEAEPDKMDWICGDFSPGRFAWRLADPYKLPIPIPFKGKQGWFEVPDFPACGNNERGSISH